MTGLPTIVAAAAAGLLAGRARAERAISAPQGKRRQQVGGWFVQQGEDMFLTSLGRARVARFGPFPVRPEEVVYLTTGTDHSGTRLRSDRSYRVAGGVLDSGFWSIAAYDKERYFFPNELDRFSMSSVTAPVQAHRYSFDVGPAPGPAGRDAWLPTTGAGPVILVLRLYGPSPDLLSDLAAQVPTVTPVEASP